MYKLLGVLQGRVRVCRNTPEGEIDTCSKKMWIITSCADMALRACLEGKK
jgi:hypothetical protein